MISVIYCTRKANRSHYDHIRKTSGMGANQLEVIEIVNEGESLTKAYNRGLKQASHDIVVFCHDDIIFNKDGWGRKLVKHFNNSDFGILGIAGTTDLDESGRWWTDFSKMVGIVKHSNQGRTWESRYSGNFTDRIIETVTVDGLFFAIHKGRVKKDFDEAVEGFHFYEVDYTFRNHLAGTKVGVIFDVKVTHKSIGETNEEWEKNRLIFVDKFKDKLPVKIDVEPILLHKEIKHKNKPRVKVIVSSGEFTDKLVTLHKKLAESGYENYDISAIVDSEDVERYEKLKLDGVTIHEGAFENMHKSLSVLKWDEDFINEESELVLFLNDKADIQTDILNKFVSIYNKNSKNFGCIFPRILNEDNTILGTGILVNVMANGEKSHINYNLKGMNSYYSYQEGVTQEPLGNLGFCFMTTYKNLQRHGWFRLDFTDLFYETDFVAKCNLDGKAIYVDNDSVVKLDENYLSDAENIKQLDEDFRVLAKCFNENPATGKFMKLIEAPQQPQPVA